MLIAVDNLEKIYQDGDTATPALRGVSFSVLRGEFVAIMGPSGSGKSTLLHILGFLDHPSRGIYFFNGKDAQEYSPEESARVRNENIGFVFQQFNLLPRASVLENVKLPFLYSDIPERQWEKKARAAIESVGLSARVNHEPSELSGGERQRVAIARALVNDPDIIFADEPTGNLDSRSGGQVMEILQDLNREKGKTILLITHETYTAEMAERIITMKDGQIESDRKVSVQKSAKEKFVK